MNYLQTFRIFIYIKKNRRIDREIDIDRFRIFIYIMQKKKKTSFSVKLLRNMYNISLITYKFN